MRGMVTSGDWYDGRGGRVGRVVEMSLRGGRRLNAGE